MSSLASQLKSLGKFNLRQLVTTCRSVWPGLNGEFTLNYCHGELAPFPVATCRPSSSLAAERAKFAGDDIATIGNENEKLTVTVHTP